MTVLQRIVRAVGAAGALWGAPLLAQRAVPQTYAITNARIVPVAGPAIATGTVVVRNGLIAAVGAAVPVPGDARVIDGTGLTVYPGFIDAYGSIGVSSSAPAATLGGGRGAGGPSAGAAAGGRAGVPNSSYPAGLQPDVDVVALLKADGDAMAGPQSAGFTTAHTGSGSGIFQGKSALINLAGTEVNAMVVKADVSQQIGFTPLRNGGYPNSLMGVFASLRQILLDAQHYRDLQAAYAKNPRGMKRPEFDASLDALQAVIAGKQPVVLAASTQREIERALDLAKEFGLKAIIAGGSEAPAVAARLAQERVPVLLSTNFPRRTAAPSPDADPDPIRVLRERAEAPKAPGALAKAGVTFAMQSGGTSNWSDVLANVRRAVDNGLSADQALRALTLTPAEILGVADRMGSIEVGKIANLTITRGDVFDRAGQVTQLFIDGAPVAVRAATPAANGATMGGRGAGAAAGAAGGADVMSAAGTWTMTVTLDAVDNTVTLQLRQEGQRLVGTMQGMLGSAEIQNGSIGADGSFQFMAPITMKEGTEEATFAGTLEGNAIRGRLTIVGHAPGTFSGTRPARGPR